MTIPRGWRRAGEGQAALLPLWGLRRQRRACRVEQSLTHCLTSACTDPVPADGRIPEEITPSPPQSGGLITEKGR